VTRAPTTTKPAGIEQGSQSIQTFRRAGAASKGGQWWGFYVCRGQRNPAFASQIRNHTGPSRAQKAELRLIPGQLKARPRPLPPSGDWLAARTRVAPRALAA